MDAEEAYKRVAARIWSPQKEDILKGPYDYLSKVPGKDMRSKLIRAFNIVLQVPADKLELISSLVGMLHTASLLIDDVEDSSLLRRGFPVAHSIFGTAQTINSSNYIYFQALQEVTKLNSSEAVEIYTEELVNLHRGQGLDLYWRETLECPSEEDYLEMVNNKTGGLYRLAVRLMQSVSSVEIDLTSLANVFGIIYQIQDDYLNLQSKKYSTNKGFCEDLTEGKFSFPIIHSIRSNRTNKEIINILKQKTTDVTLKEYAVNYMRNETHSFQYCEDVIKSFEKLARGMIADLPAGIETGSLEQILSAMLNIK
ncbi:similar to Saccharomyces cerevisiae YPL069C BTS1 Geranylgeranyl diphosphate synthase [Geotrichum candidum]|uniref:Similar to Saccharomyces cerevisiae YPL069C BTS1 Geranylgeranyl diphosphate synthase n=1 Tax=Geotrichum candidum TaxID=1173061 RepID=A0A0J9X7P9_GEOCN|nr:similar to Saccharomyces cerevisiae YPL069C BTS1 Geranylgeranyl diphosphate synthase [Geotrichum candidum]